MTIQPDRTKAPDIQNLAKIALVKANKIELDNGLPLYVINAGTQELVQIELIFLAGVWYQNKNLVASFTSQMLYEGTQNLSSAAIAEKLDFYGAYVDFSIDKDMAFAAVYVLNKHLEHVLPVVSDILLNSVFPEKEFEVIVSNKKQEFMVNNEKVSYLAHKNFELMLFGEAHPYGKSAIAEDFDVLKTTDLSGFFNQHYLPSQCQLIVSGNVSEKEIRLINQSFGSAGYYKPGKANNVKFESSNLGISQHFVEKKDAVQSAIRVGMRLFKISHPDYLGMTVLNTILGGYFGSRLMTNIREEKGYTYGISSRMINHQHDGYFVISTETGIEFTNKVLDEINLELRRLCISVISNDELMLVKNYMLGSFMQSADGPFNQAGLLKRLLLNNLNNDFYNQYIETIKNIEGKDLQALALKYFAENSMNTLIVGRK